MNHWTLSECFCSKAEQTKENQNDWTLYTLLLLLSKQKTNNNKTETGEQWPFVLLTIEWSVSRLKWCWAIEMLSMFIALFYFLAHHWSMSFVNMRERTKMMWTVWGTNEHTNMMSLTYTHNSHFKPVLIQSLNMSNPTNIHCTICWPCVCLYVSVCVCRHWCLKSICCTFNLFLFFRCARALHTVT